MDSTQNNATEVATALLLQVERGDYAGAAGRLGGELAGSLPAAGLERTWLGLLGQVGAFRGILRSELGSRRGEVSVTVTCSFEKGLLDFVMVVSGEGRVTFLTTQPAADSSAYTVPDYVDAAAFGESEIRVGEGSAWPLAGSLCLPRDGGPHAGVVLVHGSGPQDRDETIGPNKVFRDVAWGLASAGVATLRYEKRTKAYAERLTSEQAEAMTIDDEVVDDALRAAELMRKTPGIDASRVFVLGHSLGATLAPRIAQKDPAIAGLVLMAGLTRPLEDTILDQVTYLAGLQGAPGEAERAQIDDLTRKVARVKDMDLSVATPRGDLPLNVPAAYWLSLRGYRPAELAAGLAIPMLVLQGGRDYQVTADGDFPAWRAALEGKVGTSLKLYPHLNHAFMPGEGPPSPADYLAPGHVRSDVVSDIVRWIGSLAR